MYVLIISMHIMILSILSLLCCRFDTNEVTCLHLVSANVLYADLIELMISDYDADVDVQDKDGSYVHTNTCSNFTL